MIYGYARVSSNTQAKEGNSLEYQTKVLLEHGCDEVYSEAYTGTTTQRPELQKILGKIKKGDTLVVMKLDRLSRSVVEGVALINDLHQKGIIVEVLNMGKVDYTAMGKLMLTMLLGFAEFEHDNIVERLADGKAVAKSHGKKTDGRYRKAPPEFSSYLALQREGLITVEKACKELGIGKTTWYKLAKEESV